MGDTRRGPGERTNGADGMESKCVCALAKSLIIVFISNNRKKRLSDDRFRKQIAWFMLVAMIYAHGNRNKYASANSNPQVYSLCYSLLHTTHNIILLFSFRIMVRWRRWSGVGQWWFIYFLFTTRIRASLCVCAYLSSDFESIPSAICWFYFSPHLSHIEWKFTHNNVCNNSNRNLIVYLSPFPFDVSFGIC